MKLAVIGTGRIVHEALSAMKDLIEEGKIELSAVFTREHSRAVGEELARQYGIGQVFTDFDELLHAGGADTVYIGLVNSAHYQYAKKALEAGYYVILEKPLTESYHEAAELMTLAAAKDRFVLEAMTVFHSPAFDAVQKALPRIGAPKLLLADYSQYSSRYDDYLQGKIAPAFENTPTGGALPDINIYNIAWCVGLFGKPDGVSYFPNRGWNGVDTSGTAVLTYKGENTAGAGKKSASGRAERTGTGFTAVLTGAKDCDGTSFVEVQGEKGFVRLEGKPNSAGKVIVHAVHEGDAPAAGNGVKLSAAGSIDRQMDVETYDFTGAGHRMTREFRDFAEIIDTHDSTEALKLEMLSLTMMEVLERARAGRNEESYKTND